MPVTWVGPIGGKTGGTGNGTSITVEWDETVGRTMIMILSQARGLLSGQTQETVVWGVPDGWNFVKSATQVDDYDPEVPTQGSFVSQAIYFRVGTENLDNKTATISHTGRSGGFARGVIYGMDDASPFGAVFSQQGYAANPTGAISAGFRDAIYIAAYADSDSDTPTWNPDEGYTEVDRGSYARLGWAHSYLNSASGWKNFPRINGANVVPARQEHPWIYDMIVFGTEDKSGWFRGHPWG